MLRTSIIDGAVVNGADNAVELESDGSDSESQEDEMAPTTRQCEYAGCEEVFVIDNLETYLGLLRIHVDAKHSAPRTSAKAEKARRPELTLDTSEEGWSYFKARFDQYKKATGLEGEQVVTQLLECCSEAVRVDHHRTYSGLNGTRDEKTVLKELRSIAVKKQNIAVNRIKLTSLQQDRGESVRKFAGRVRSLAAVSKFSVKCCCKDEGCSPVSYTEEMIVDQVIRGLANQEIQKDVLSSDPMDLEKLLLYVEGKESGLASQGLMIGTSGVASVVQPAANTEEVKKKEKCRTCGSFLRWSCKNGQCPAKKKTCNNCGKMGHLATVCKAAKKSNRVDHVDPDGESQHSDCSIFLRDNKSNFMYPRVSLPENDDNDDKYREVLSNVMTVMVGAAISATTTLHHHVFDTVSQN